MSAHDLVVARVRDAMHAIVNQVGECPEDGTESCFVADNWKKVQR